MSVTLYEMSLVLRETRPISRCDWAYSYVWRDSLLIPMTYFYAWYPSCLIDICDMAHLYLWCDSFWRVTWLNDSCDMTHSQGDMIPLYVWCMYDFTSVFHMCDTTLTYVWHDPLLCVTRLYYIRDMTHYYVSHDSITYVTWPIVMCNTTHSQSPNHTRDMTHPYACLDSTGTGVPVP